jgi:hypothetical protein
MLKAGILEDGLVHPGEVGTPQGSILSPVLSNIYLHYVLDLWFHRRVKRSCRGEAYLFRFADEKTRYLEFGRYARANAYQRGEKPKDFDFLGMTFYCGKTHYGSFKVKRKTSRKKLRQSLARFTDWIRRYRNLRGTGELLRQAKARVTGHLNYYAITDNSDECHRYMHLTTGVLFKWLNRRSQRKLYTWAGFHHALQHVGWPTPRIRVDMNPLSPRPNV